MLLAQLLAQHTRNLLRKPDFLVEDAYALGYVEGAAG
jgi:hypothetical protein